MRGPLFNIALPTNTHTHTHTHTAGDPRMPDKKWQRIVRKTPAPVYQRVGQKASLPAVEASDKSDEMDTEANPEDPNLL